MKNIVLYKINNLKRFPAQDELGTCRTSLVSPEQPVLCILVRQQQWQHCTCTIAYAPNDSTDHTNHWSQSTACSCVTFHTALQSY